MKAICGIYMITHPPSGMSYIGQSIDIKKRWREHLAGEGNALLARAVRAYGWAAFTTVILLECPPEDLDAHEIAFIKSKNSQFPGGFNLLDGGQNAPSPEERARREAAKLERLWVTNPKRAMAIVERARWDSLTLEEKKAELRAKRKAQEEQRAREQEIRRIAFERSNEEIMAEVNFCAKERFTLSQADFAYGRWTINAETVKSSEAVQAAIRGFEFAAQQAKYTAEFAANWAAKRTTWSAEELGWAGERQKWEAKAIFWSNEAVKLLAKADEWKGKCDSLNGLVCVQPD